ALALGAGPHAEDVGTRLGLAGAIGPEEAAVAQAGQVAPLLGLGAEDHDRHRDGPERSVEREDQARVGTAVTQSLHGGDGRGQVLALPAVLRRDGQARDAEPRATRVTLAPELAA